MAIFENLKSLFKTEIAGKLKTAKDIASVKILNNNKFGSLLNIDNRKQLVINIGKLETKQQEESLKKLIKEAVGEKNPILETQSQNLLENFESAESQTQNKELIEYFEGKLPGKDLQIFRASLYLKVVLDQNDRGEASKLKSDITDRYGKRGANIANLTTAGYFSTVIKPLYEEMRAIEGFTIEEFHKKYEIIVEQYLFAIFVNRDMTIESLKLDIKRKIDRNRMYGVRKLDIHGIGHSNVIKIQDALKQLKNELTASPAIEQHRDILRVTIYF